MVSFGVFVYTLPLRVLPRTNVRNLYFIALRFLPLIEVSDRRETPNDKESSIIPLKLLLNFSGNYLNEAFPLHFGKLVELMIRMYDFPGK